MNTINGKKNTIRILTQNRDYVQTYCNDIRNPFPTARRKRCLNINPQCQHITITLIQIRRIE